MEKLALFSAFSLICRTCVQYASTVYYIYYAEWQEAYRTAFMPNGPIIGFRGAPSGSQLFRGQREKKLLILDDFMGESSSDVILDLFTKENHHKNISVIFIPQNVFHKGKAQRDISLSTKYLVLFKNLRDKAQIQHLARQIYPEDSAFLRDAYIDATHAPHAYLFIDLSQECLDEFRFRANILSDTNDTH